MSKTNKEKEAAVKSAGKTGKSNNNKQKLKGKADGNYKLFGLSSSEYDNICSLLGKTPDDFELGIFSAMWSEHCSYKSSKVYLKTLPTEGSSILIGPGENAGVVDFGDDDVLVFKMESHNHPSFIEPFQGSATGVGGIMRDIFTMGARPVANLNSLRFGAFSHPRTPYYISEVVKGIGFYGNCMGVPTVGGEVVFDECYNDNILVNAFTIGIAKKDGIFLSSKCKAGHAVVYVGSSTGMDGIHGATMASEEFDLKKNKRRSTVQVGDPFTEKLLLEACLEAMGKKLIISIQDMGAAGLTSSSFEMSDKSGHGMIINLDEVPLRTPGMSPVEIMLSESQERMLIACDKKKLPALKSVFDKWGLNCFHIGEVIKEKVIKFYHGGKLYKTMGVDPVVNGPAYERPVRKPAYFKNIGPLDASSLKPVKNINNAVRLVVSHPNMASKRPVFTQYDYTIGTDTVVPPGFSSAVMRVKGSPSGAESLFLAKDGRRKKPAGSAPVTEKGFMLDVNGNSRYAYLNPYTGGVIAVTESARNISACGGKPVAITDCLNFASPEDPEIMWQFAEVIRGIKDAAVKLETPVISGNVSFYNETAKAVGEKVSVSKINPTPVIGMLGFIADASDAVTPYFKDEGDEIFLLGKIGGNLGGSIFMEIAHKNFMFKPLEIDLDYEVRLQECIRSIAASKLIKSASDISEGGAIAALVESAVTRPGGSVGLSAELKISGLSEEAVLFSEFEQAFILTASPKNGKKLEKAAAASKIEIKKIGEVSGAVININNSICLKSDKIKEEYYSVIKKILP